MTVATHVPVEETRPATASAVTITGRDYVSWSQLDVMRRCPQRFYLQYVEDTMPQFVPSSLVFGGAVHSALEAFYQGRLEGETLGVDELHDAYDEREVPPIKQTARWRRDRCRRDC